MVSPRKLALALALLLPLPALVPPVRAAEIPPGAEQAEVAAVPERTGTLDAVEAAESRRTDADRKGGESPEVSLILVSVALVLIILIAA